MTNADMREATTQSDKKADLLDQSAISHDILNPRPSLQGNASNHLPHRSPLDHAIESEVIPRLVGLRRDGTDPADAVNRSRETHLNQLIELDILPRLMVAHGLDADEIRRSTEMCQDKASTSRAPINTASREQFSAEQISVFADLLLSDERAAPAAKVETLLAHHASREAVLLHLMAPAARLLGEYWKEDRVSFAQVTIALARLQQVLRGIGSQSTSVKPNGHRILLASVPGDQHTFGVFMVEEFFRRAGWDVVTCVLDSYEEVHARVASETFSVLGFSISRQDLLEELVFNTQTVYKVSRNKEIRILLGGSCFVDTPERFGETGADGMAKDGREAVALANKLIGLAAPR